MKQIIYILMTLLVIGIVSAGSIEGLQYKDKNLFWDKTRTTNDNNVDIDADTLQGKSYADIKYEMEDEVTTTANWVVSQSKDRDKAIEDTIEANNERWLEDGGIGMSRVVEYLFEDFVSYLRTIFVTKDDFAIHEAVNVLGFDTPAVEIYCYAARLRSLETGQTHIINGIKGNVKLDKCTQNN